MMRSITTVFRRVPSITYAITVCNEKDELKALLTQLFLHLKKSDQVIVLQDISNANSDVEQLIKSYGDRVLHLKAKLNGDFSTFKNRLIAPAKGEYLFQIDADEIPTSYLLANLGSFLKKYHRVECFCVPRVNVVEGITEAYIKKWNWIQNEEGYINFPDFQMRLFKLQSKKIKWVNKVHERLEGYRSEMNMPSENYDFCLIHKKVIEKQVSQNDFYTGLN